MGRVWHKDRGGFRKVRAWIGIAGAAVGFALILSGYAVFGSAVHPSALAVMAVVSSIWLWWTVPGVGPVFRLGAGALHAVGFASLWAAGASEVGLPGGFKAGLVLGSLLVGAALAGTGWRRPEWAPSCAAAGATLCAWLIAAFSGSQGAPGSYPSWLELLFGLDPAAAEAVSTVSRKFLHFFFYGLFGLLTLRAMPGRPSWRRFGVALLIVALYASTDEARQMGTRVRSGSPWDVLLDLSGAAALMALSAFWRRGNEG
jgi:VanZ family protein